jgi:hypothetical protein
MKFPAFAVTLALATLAYPASGPDDAKLFRTKLDKEQQILHALDRLTFGPRTGDVEKVRALGLKKWIELQLNPDSIPEDPDLESKLKPLASLNMSPLQVVQHYPSPQLIKAIAMGKEKLPDDDPLLRASLMRLVARYKVNKDEKNTDPNAEMEPGRNQNAANWYGRGKTGSAGFVPGRPAGYGCRELTSEPTPATDQHCSYGGAPQISAAAESTGRGEFRPGGIEAAARDLQQSPTGRRVGRFLVQPFQCELREGRGSFRRSLL